MSPLPVAVIGMGEIFSGSASLRGDHTLTFWGSESPQSLEDTPRPTGPKGGKCVGSEVNSGLLPLV